MNAHPSPDQLAASAYGDLTGDAAESVRDHLAGCVECGAQVESFAAVRSLLDQWPLARPASPQTVSREHPIPARTGRARWTARLLAGAAAAACMALGFAAGTQRQPDHSAVLTRLSAEHRAATDAALQRLQAQHDERLRQLADALGDRLDATERRQHEYLSSSLQRLWTEVSSRTDSLRSDLKAIAFVADAELSATRRRMARLAAADADAPQR